MSGNNGNNERKEGIAIIGLGCVYPKAHTIDQYWQNILNKVSGIKEIPKDRWDYNLYYDPDKNAPDKTYSKIGGFVDDVDMTDIIKKYKLPPKIVKVMDRAQKYALVSADRALTDAGYETKEFDRNRTAVIIGNSMGGDMIDYTNYRIFMSDVDNHLKKGDAFKKLDPASQKMIMEELQKNVKATLPEITEDSMPGELSNVIAGRIANAMNITGPNFSVDAACASSMASIRDAVRGLRNYDFDMVVAGGTDYMMNPGPYVKFSKIGALSPDGSYPFDARANGFVMGEGTGIFILKRVSDARRDGNKIYAIIRGIGASSDGRGKGITAPNPKGQILAVSRAFEDAGYSSDTVQYVEAHGTATIVGDVAELEALLEVWDKGVKNNSVGLGSIKSNIGHLKAAAGSAAVIKTALALHHKIFPPNINYEKSNPNVKFGSIPFRVITNSEPWPAGINGNPRRANASAFGFGGTNFHVAIEEDTGENGMPEERKYYSSASAAQNAGSMQIMKDAAAPVCDYSHQRYKLSKENGDLLGGEAVVIGASSWNEIKSILDNLKSELSANPKTTLKDIGLRFNMASNSKDVRLGISAYSIEDFVDKFDAAKEGIDNLKRRVVLKNRGLFYGDNLLAKKKSLSKVGVLFPGQGNQYVNMLKDLYNKFKVVKDTFDEADRVMFNIIGKGMTDIVFLPDDASKDEFDKAENQLKQTEYTQPGVLTADYAMFRLLKSYGIKPDVAVGHSLGEYGALIAAEVMEFKDALFAVSARGREIAAVKIDDVGKMLSVPAPVAKTENLLKGISGYAIIANKNCHSQTVVAGDTPSVMKVKERCEAEGIPAQLIPVSHAFHSQIVAPACPSYRRVIDSFKINSPKIDIIANLTGEYYPKGAGVRQQIVDILVNHIANPVEFIKQIDKMYADGVNVFVEAGPKRTLTSFVVNILEGKEYLAMATNHPKKGGIGTLNDALAAMSTEGFDINWNGVDEEGSMKDHPDWRLLDGFPGKRQEIRVSAAARTETASAPGNEIVIKERKGDVSTDAIYGDFQQKQKDLLNEILDIYSKKSSELLDESLSEALYYKKEIEKFNINLENVVISGIAIGLPGKRFSVFGDDVFDRILAGENMIDPLTDEEMERQLNKNINRLMKSPDGEATFHKIGNKSEVVKLAARKGKFDFEDEYGISSEFADRLDIATKLAIAAGIEALKDAGIPLVMNYKTTSTGKLLPTTWGLSEELQDETGIIFCSAFPGYNALIEEVSKEVAYKYGSRSKQELVKLYTSIMEKVKDGKVREDLSGWFAENYSILKEVSDDNVYQFNRRFLFKILSMGHSQFAEFIKAKGPNIQINVACSSTTAAVGIAEDWIRLGRCKRVIIVGGDDVTAEPFLEWIMSGFLAVGAVSTKQDIREAAIPFDRRRNGMLVGMGAVGIIVEAESEIKKRGMEPIGQVVAVEFFNSAFHGTRLDVNHISKVMERLIKNVEKRTGIKRDELSKHTVFMSHETYTPARGGSAAAEAESLRKTFGPDYRNVVVANTKGFTGHSMAVGVEDAVVLKALQRGIVPPIANHKETDPELGDLNLSRGGEYKDLRYALRLGAGFGSQIAMSFIELRSKKENRIIEQATYSKWLKEISYIENPEIEIVKRTLRVKKEGRLLKTAAVIEAPARQAAPVAKPAVAAVQQQAVTPEPAAAVTQVAAAGPLNGIKKKIMKIVGEKTGYPEDLIEFDLDMESDLGIDTVKQAEMFGMIRETFGIPKDENIRVKDFPTLGHVITFVQTKSPQFKGVDFSAAAARKTVAVQPVITQSSKPAGKGPLDDIKNKIMKIVGEKTGYAEDLIEFDLDMESDLGIDTVKQAEMFGMIREEFNISKEENIKIKDFPTLNHVVNFVQTKSPQFRGVDFSAAAAGAAVFAPNATVTVSTRVTAAAQHAVISGDDIIKKKIMAIVGEKTGYPEDLIEFDLDMESDLGIDTVKQAEMFGMIREEFNISKDEAIKIKDFPTLNHVVNFVKAKSPQKFESVQIAASVHHVQAQPAQPVIRQAEARPSTGSGLDEIRRRIVKIVEEKTGYSEDLIEFDLDMESDLGIDTVKQAEMFGMIRESFEISKEESIKIKDFPTLNHVVEFVRAKSPQKFADVPVPAPQAPAATPHPHAAVSAPKTAGYALRPTNGSGLDEIRKKIVKIVEEKTGYSEDLIEFDLDMESDLGIDTVKQAEMFGMIRETFDIPKDEAIKIKDFPTLNHVVQFVKAKSPHKFADAVVQPDTAAAVSAPVPGIQQTAAKPASGDGMDDIRKKIIKIVEEKTGYSEDLIEFDLDMESDLGIDTVKQAEMFGMIRERFNIPKDEAIKIKDFPTLNHVIEFVRTKSPQYKNVGVAVSAPQAAVSAQPAAVQTAAQPARAGKESRIKRMTLEVVEEAIDKKAQPKFNMKGFNILLTDDGRGVAAALEKLLAEEGAKVITIKQADMEKAESLTKELERVKNAGKMNGIIHLTSIEESKDLGDMSFEDWRLNVFRRVKSMYLISKTLQDDIAANGKAGKAFVVSATDMGGTFGVDDFTANNPIGGGVAGLTKSLNKEFNREKKEVRVKHIDFSLKEKPAAIAKNILNEIQLGGDRVEVGYTDKKRFVPQVIYKDIDMDSKPRDVYKKGSVFVITGGGYGITSAIAKDLAKNLNPKLAIISLEPLQSNIADLAKLDENGLKLLKDRVVAELKTKNERVTPVMIDKEFRKYTIAIEIYNNLKEMRELGAVGVEYYDCNVMDNRAMTAVMQKIRDKFGPIDAIIHGAGIEQSKLMTDKSFDDFCRVVDVKADGCYNLMEFAKKDKVKALVTFASISGRFGNIGQTDYSAANDLLNKYVEHANRRFAPQMKGVSLNWSGWMGVGMATRGSITQIFEEAKIDMIPMEEGVTKVREELLYGNDAEVIVAGNVGYIDIDKLIAGEKTKEFTALADLVKSERDRYPLIDEILSYKPGKKITAKKRLDTETDLYLKDHAIADVPYLPAVMGIETFAEISSLLFRGKKVKLMRDIKFNIPVKILKGKPVELIIMAEKISTDGDEITLKTSLETEFFNKDGIKLGDNKLHFEATVVVSEKGADKKMLKAGKLKLELLEKYRKDGKKIISEKEIYKRFFHGPKYQVHGGVIDIGDSMIYGVISQKNGKDGSHFSFVKKANYLTDPMAIEAAFQNAGLYAMKHKNLMSLPDGISELAFTNIPEDAELLFVRAKHVGSDDIKHEYDTEVIDSKGNTYSVMKGYKMVTTGELKEDEKF